MSIPPEPDSKDISKAQDQSVEYSTDFGTAFGKASPLKKTGRQTKPSSKTPDPSAGFSGPARPHHHDKVGYRQNLA